MKPFSTILYQTVQSSPKRNGQPLPAVVARLILHMGPARDGSTGKPSDVLFVFGLWNCYPRSMLPHFDLTAALDANDIWRISVPA